MTARQIARWRSALNNRVDAAAGMTRITFDIIVETMLGGSAMLDVERYGHALTRAFAATQWLYLLAMLSAPSRVPFPGRHRAIKARDYLHQEMGRILATRRAKPTSRADLLDRLLTARNAETGSGMTDAELVTNLLTFINAGHDTTAAALTWTLWLVARDVTVQQQVFEEVRAVVGEKPIEAKHIEGLALSRQVIQEALRLYPPVPTLLRQAKLDTSLGVHHVNPSTQIVIPTFALHRHTRLWGNPNVFDPGRFAPDHVKARSRYIYLPFGAGPRTCIGASFAMIEAVVILAMLVRAFRFRPVPSHKPKPIARVSLRPQGGMPLLIEPR
jgi:cytochrome P450